MNIRITTKSWAGVRNYNVEFDDNATVNGLTEDEAKMLRDRLTTVLGPADFPHTNDPCHVAPAPFKENAAFKDIRKGDRVWTEYTFNDVKVIHEGTADHKDNAFGDWMTASGKYLYAEEARDNNGTITILERPESEWKVGDVVIDAHGGKWLYDADDEDWTNFSDLFEVLRTGDLVTEHGPLTRAKVVPE